LIDRRGTDKIFCNEVFIDNGVIILKLDGTKHEFFVLANENVVPNLDVIGYLNNLLDLEDNGQKEIIKTYELENGLEVEIHSDSYIEYLSGSKALVTVDGENIRNGFYKLKNNNVTLVIKNSRIIQVAYEKIYKTEDNIALCVLQRHRYVISKSDYVLIDGQLVSDGFYFFSKSLKIYTEDGLIKKIFSRLCIFNRALGKFKEVN
ncbi:MAG: hypothetical protein ACK4UK_07425, partial [Flavobacterium sp.]